MRKHTSTLFSCVLLFFIFLLTTRHAKAQYLYPYETRVDSIDILHYDIHLDVTDFTTFQLYAHTKVHFRPKVNGISFIDLDLIGLGVDSIIGPSGNLLTHTPLTLGHRINLGTTYNLGDTTSLEVYYHGAPISDPNFGGFYFNSQFAFAVGIDIDAVPHNYGKTWFPCFDNFIERTTFDFYIKTLPIHTVTCNGMPQDTTVNADSTILWHWRMDVDNPTYITSIAVSNYTNVIRQLTNYQNDTIEAWLVCPPADTAAMQGSFVNLQAAFNILESKWGPYPFERVGYAMVPLPGGAMEHTMNIAYPLSLIDGHTTYETVIYHELGHHWFGNTITPRTAEDIWMKEAFAVYSEYIFTENLYGRPQYDGTVRNEHKQLLWTCHFDDNGYWPLSGIPQQYVYGTATYYKGADIVHTLRSYMGDSLFFSSLQQLVVQDAGQPLDAGQFRDHLSTISGFNLNNFFDDWILQGGWPHVSIDSMKATQAGSNYTVNVYLKQKLVGRSNYSTQVPMTLSLRDDNWQLFEQTIYSTGANNMVTVTVPFLPTVAYLNGDEKIAHAVSAKYNVVKTTGTTSMANANFTLNTSSIVDSAYMIVEHNWAAPDPVTDWTKGFTISPQRYWRVDGIWNPGSVFSGTVYYNGRPSGTNSRLDQLLITGTEDSLIMLYRPDRAHDWVECPNYTRNMGSATDKIGTMTINNLQKGEYTLALKGQTIGIEEQDVKTSRIYPNPAVGLFNIECYEEYDLLSVTNIWGQEVYKRNMYMPLTQLDASYWAKGLYLVNAYKGNQRVFSNKLIVQ